MAMAATVVESVDLLVMVDTVVMVVESPEAMEAWAAMVAMDVELADTAVMAVHCTVKL